MEKNVVRGRKRRHDAEMKLKDAEYVWLGEADIGHMMYVLDRGHNPPWER